MADLRYEYDFGRPLSPGQMGNLLATYSVGGKASDMNAFDLNLLSYNTTLADLLNLYMGVFRWEGLPEGVSARQLEYWLMLGGVVAFVRDPVIQEAQPVQAPEGYAVVRCMLTGPIDIYDLPEDARAYSMVSAVNGMELDPEKTVLIWDNLLRTSALPQLTYYARRLSNIDRTIDVNVANQKTTKVVRGTQKQMLSLQNAMSQQQGNQVIRWEDAATADPDAKPVDYDVTAPYVASDLQLLKRQLKSEVLTFCGIDNTYGDKRERMITGEVEQGSGDITAHKLSREEPRRVAAERISELFGLDVSVVVAADERARERAEEQMALMGAGTADEREDDTGGDER